MRRLSLTTTEISNRGASTASTPSSAKSSETNSSFNNLYLSRGKAFCRVCSFSECIHKDSNTPTWELSHTAADKNTILRPLLLRQSNNRIRSRLISSDCATTQPVFGFCIVSNTMWDSDAEALGCCRPLPPCDPPASDSVLVGGNTGLSPKCK